MRLYTASSEETLRARKLLKDWAGEGFLTKAQYQRLEQETVSELRTTNIFLRLVLFLFTLISVGAAAGAVLRGFSFAAIGANRRHFPPDLRCRLLRGCRARRFPSPACIATGSRKRSPSARLVFSARECRPLFSAAALIRRSRTQPSSLVPAAGAVFSLWIWRRFGLWYAFLAAMIFVVFLPGYWTSSHAAQHLIVAVFYAAGLVGVAAVRSRHRFDYLEDELFARRSVSLARHLPGHQPQAFVVELCRARVVGRHSDAPHEFARSFYWTTWVLIWCLPPVVLARGIRQKDRFVIAVGAIAAILTFVSNKPYLGWPRHTWDPMLLGILLTGVALFIRRWLARGPGGIRHGFTAARLSGKDKHWMNAGSAVLGLVSPQSITPGPQTSGPETSTSVGEHSGGGGAGGDF